MTFLWLKCYCILEQKSQTFSETHIAYRLALLHYSTCSSNLQSELWITHANIPTALSRIKNVIFFSSVETDQRHLCRVIHLIRQNLMLISKLQRKKVCHELRDLEFVRVEYNRLLQKIFRGKVCRIKIFLGIFGEFWTKYPSHPQKCACPTPRVAESEIKCPTFPKFPTPSSNCLT